VAVYVDALALGQLGIDVVGPPVQHRGGDLASVHTDRELHPDDRRDQIICGEVIEGVE